MATTASTPTFSVLIRERTEYLIAATGSEKALAGLLGVEKSQTGRWRSGEDHPSPQMALELIDLDHVVARAMLLWTPEVALEWLTSANDFFDGARPIDVLRVRGSSGVLAALDASAAGAIG